LKIHDYHTSADKNVIKEYLQGLPKTERFVGYHIRHKLGSKGLAALEELDTRQLRDKLWEIKFLHHRYMYVIEDKNNFHILHICKKQKGKAELFEIETAIKRAKELKLPL